MDVKNGEEAQAKMIIAPIAEMITDNKRLESIMSSKPIHFSSRTFLLPNGVGAGVIEDDIFVPEALLLQYMMGFENLLRVYQPRKKLRNQVLWVEFCLSLKRKDLKLRCDFNIPFRYMKEAIKWLYTGEVSFSFAELPNFWIFAEMMRGPELQNAIMRSIARDAMNSRLSIPLHYAEKLQTELEENHDTFGLYPNRILYANKLLRFYIDVLAWKTKFRSASNVSDWDSCVKAGGRLAILLAKISVKLGQDGRQEELAPWAPENMELYMVSEDGACPFEEETDRIWLENASTGVKVKDF